MERWSARAKRFDDGNANLHMMEDSCAKGEEVTVYRV